MRKPNTVPPMSERELQRHLVAAARDAGWLVHHQTVALYSAAGMPDLELCKPPCLIKAELKGLHGKLSEKQREWLDALALVPGIEVYLWTPADLEQIYLRLLGQQNNLVQWGKV